MATKDSGISHIGILARKMTKFEFSTIFVEFRPFLDMRSTAGRPGPVDRRPVDRAAATLLKTTTQSPKTIAYYPEASKTIPRLKRFPAFISLF